MIDTDRAAATPAPEILELAPKGHLRAGVVVAPVAGVFFVEATTRDGLQPRGVTVDLLRALADSAGLVPRLFGFPNSGECTEALARGDIDVAFMPVDEERMGMVAFGSAYYLLRSTFLVAGGTGIEKTADLNRDGAAFVGIEGTTTMRAATRTVGKATPVAARSVDEAIRLFDARTVVAIALSEDYLRQLQPRFPGSLLLSDAFQQTTVSIAVPPRRPGALAYVSAFLEDAKRTGLVRRIFDGHGLDGEEVAPG